MLLPMRTGHWKTESTKYWKTTEEMAGDQFRVQELNPFLEWHLHTTATSLEVASEEARRIARMIGRKTRVLSEVGEVLTEVDP